VASAARRRQELDARIAADAVEDVYAGPWKSRLVLGPAEATSAVADDRNLLSRRAI
jgi:hypothetical protein